MSITPEGFLINEEYPPEFSDDKARERAEQHNCDILYSDEWTLQLDLDSDAAADTCSRQLELLESLGLIPLFPTVEYLASKSGNRHAIVKLNQPLSVERRILLQALLGSDLKREALSLAGLLAGTQANPVLLFRPRTNT